jgi:hypothetical protein
MSDSEAFSSVCAKLEAESSLDQLESRGTVRLALKQAGLTARSVTSAQMAVVLESVLPNELEIRGIDNPSGLCRRLKSYVLTLENTLDADSPEAVFDRLGGSTEA